MTTAWTPPELPNPSTVLDEAVADTRAGRHEVALSKFVWFHANALSYEPSLYGVRLSFALEYWHDLAEECSAAMGELVATRDRTEARFLSGGFAFHDFHDLAALNRTLGDLRRTVEVFVTIHDHNHDVAESLYPVAQPALIECGAFDICGDYLQPEQQYHRAMELHALELACEHLVEGNSSLLEVAQQRLVHTLCTLVALLVKNNRIYEAQQVATRALRELNGQSWKKELDSALTGCVPASWP